MNKETFKEILKEYNIFLTNNSEYYKFGIDLMEGKYPIMPCVDKILDLIFNSVYTDLGVDWIYWFIYDNDFGNNNLEATDDGKLICQNVDDLFDYIEQYKK